MDNLQQLVNQDPDRSRRPMARELGLSNLTVEKEKSQDIHYFTTRVMPSGEASS
jgi:hypothetical protein